MNFLGLFDQGLYIKQKSQSGGGLAFENRLTKFLFPGNNHLYPAVLRFTGFGIIVTNRA